MRKAFNKWRARKEPPPMPILPTPRARPLTAIFSSSPTATATANGPFFKLPVEIRRQILIDAFGDQIIHFDLRLQHPPQKGLSPRPPRHANGYSDWARDKKKPRRWEWFSCVCHRIPDPILLGPGNMICCPTDDQCRFGETRIGDCQELYHGDVPDVCFIGVMGWLLACRQAYVEGIQVLYGTNRIFIDRMSLFRRLPDLLVPQRLTDIRQVELFWEICPWEAHDDCETGMEGFLSSLKRLPETLPNLKFLFLSLQGKLKPKEASYWSQELFDATEKLLQHVDRMVVKLSQLTECRIAIPASCYMVRKEKIVNRDVAFYFDHEDFNKEAMWRKLPRRKSEGHSGIEGYWVCHGQRDVRHPHESLLCCGFGEPRDGV